MNKDDVYDVMRLLSGLWPRPEMADDEASVWALELANKNLDLAANVITAMARQGGPWRPTAGQFAAEYANFARHEPQPILDLSIVPELEETTEILTVDQ